MVESIGKTLSQARLKRGLTIDEAAHATKLRPDKIAALENDDYGRFANNIYARGFLQIYGRFLDVDVSDFARTLDNANPINVSDYQYLSNATPVREEEPVFGERERQRPSLAPLFAFVVLIVLGLGGAWLYANYQRIVAPSTPHAKVASQQTPEPARAKPAPEIPAPTSILVAKNPPGPTPRVTALPPPPSPATVDPGALIKAEPIATTDQDFVKPMPVNAPDPAMNAFPRSGLNEVLVASVKKTWVTIRKDDPKAQPIFEDFVYPNANPLKLKGARFFIVIKAPDPASVQITKNGLPFAYNGPDVTVQ